MTSPTSPPSSTPAPEPNPKALTLRYALIMLLALITAAVAGGLYWLATKSVPMAILTGGGTFGAAWVFFDRLID